MPLPAGWSSGSARDRRKSRVTVKGQAVGTLDAATLAAFLALALIAGGNAPAIREVSCESCELDPFWSAAMRFALASALFAAIACALRAGMPHGRALVGAALYGVLQFGVGFGLVYWGFVRAPAGLGQVLLAEHPGPRLYDEQVLAANAQQVADYRGGKEKAFNSLVGQVMKATKGKANPQQVTDILKRKLT